MATAGIGVSNEQKRLSTGRQSPCPRDVPLGCTGAAGRTALHAFAAPIALRAEHTASRIPFLVPAHRPVSYRTRNRAAGIPDMHRGTHGSLSVLSLGRSASGLTCRSCLRRTTCKQPQPAPVPHRHAIPSQTEQGVHRHRTAEASPEPMVCGAAGAVAQAIHAHQRNTERRIPTQPVEAAAWGCTSEPKKVY